MRLSAATLLVLCACNQFYGLDETHAVDAPRAVPDREIRLSMLVGGTTLGASEAPIAIVDVTPDPKPKIALVDEPLRARDYGAGIVTYPFDFVGKQWRIEYTPPGGEPVEVQWSPADKAGHLIVPVVGRVERTKVPPGTGYSVEMKKADQTLFDFLDPVIYTTGYWSATPVAASNSLPVDFSVAPSMSGPAGAPSAAAGDVVVAIDYTVDGTTGCRIPRAAGSIVAADLENGAMKQLLLTRETNSEMVVLTYKGQDTIKAQARLLNALGSRSDVQSGSRVTYGRLAHTGMPGFTTTIDDVPAPHIIPLATCPILVQAPPAVFDAGGGLAFNKGMFAFVSNDRMVSGVRLRSSIAAVGGLVSGTSTYEATFNVPLATTVALGADVLTETDGGLIASGPSDLTITIDDNPDYAVDYYEVALYRLTSNSLELVRTYVGTDPTAAKLRFDPSVMMPNAEHVFAIRTYRGRPNARQADFATVQGAQSVGTIFTRTFRR